MKHIYLDYAAATPMDPSVVKAMQSYLTEEFYNPSALYLSAKKISRDIESARKSIAKWLGARPPEIIFTAGGTESDNLAIRGIMERFPGSNLVVSAIEHEAVLKPAQAYKHKIAPVKSDGIIDLKGLEKQIDDKTVLVSIMYANNEVGSIQPLRAIAQVIKSKIENRKKQGNTLPLYFHTDACQAAAYLDLHASQLGVDLMTINAGKIYGPKQCGALFVHSHVQLKPQILGGGQERGQRSGTENVAAIMGFAKALTIVQERRPAEAKRLEALRETALELIKQKLPTAVINGSLKNRLPNNIHLTIPGQDNERLIMALDEKGVECAAGSACSASDEEPSHVLTAMGLGTSEARSSLRLTMGRQTDEKSIIYAVKTLAQIL